MTSQHFRLAIFDLDGTLADTAPDLVAALNHVLAQEGLPMADFTQARAYVGHGARVLIERAHTAHALTLSEAQATLLTEDFVAAYARNIAGGTVLFEGVLEAMHAMQQQGWRFAICTNKRQGLARQLLDALELSHRFEAISGGDSFAWRKPDGRHILSTMEAAGGTPGQVLMVGDSPPDVLAAKAAGVPVVAVRFGYANEPLEDLHPEALIDHFSQLPALAEQLVPKGQG